jgi:hypothetical protein
LGKMEFSWKLWDRWNSPENFGKDGILLKGFSSRKTLCRMSSRTIFLTTFWYIYIQNKILTRLPTYLSIHIDFWRSQINIGGKRKRTNIGLSREIVKKAVHT